MKKKTSQMNFEQIQHGLQVVTDKKTDKIIGYRGFSHRGGAIFKHGDILFDEKWKMPKTHPDYKKYQKQAEKSEFADSIMEVVPFNERGSKPIKTMADAKKAAINFSKYIS